MCFSCVKFNEICYFLGGNSFAKFSISQNWKRKNPSQNLKKNRNNMNQKTNVAPCKEEHNNKGCVTPWPCHLHSKVS
jgi:hypothetical protein